MADTTRRSTGIAGLDLALDGGFSPGTRIVIAGSPLSGLELLAQQFWQEGGGGAGAYLMLDTMPGESMIDARGGMDPPTAMAAAMAGEKIVVDSLSTLVAAWGGIDTAVRFVLEETRPIIEGGVQTSSTSSIRESTAPPRKRCGLCGRPTSSSLSGSRFTATSSSGRLPSRNSKVRTCRSGSSPIISSQKASNSRRRAGWSRLKTRPGHIFARLRVR
ncbi:hypothetical protein [Methanoculleus chikugoensis]|uniref:RAD55 family ATPase n=1 Tax=Methanoculleus chikugoensis TaxID=118126 RepID=UPI000B1203C8|nr:hypothetical protein [Methanoculleus chikugoensis]